MNRERNAGIVASAGQPARHRRSALFLLILFFAFPALANLTGRVTIGEAPGAGVTVTATSPVLRQPRTTITGPRGTYWFESLPPGEYEVTFARLGHTTLTRKAVVELAQVARADARLDPSDDEETVSSTVKSLSVAETTAITTHFDGELLERMPVERTPRGAALLAQPFFAHSATIDGAFVPHPLFIGEETVDEVTLVHGGAGADADRSHDTAVIARTRRGTDGFQLWLRDTISNGGGARHLIETASGGRIIRDRLWFFASGWGGDDAWRRVQDLNGFAVSLDAQPGAAHHVEATVLDTEARSSAGSSEVTAAAIRYTGVFGPHTTVDAVAGHSDTNRDDELFSLRGSRVFPGAAGDHVVTAGATAQTGATAFFVSDRWSLGSFVVDAGVRHEDGMLLPRIAATYDLRSNGRTALAASYGDYAGGLVRTNVAAIGFVTAIGTTGSARLDFIRTGGADFGREQARFGAQYNLFGRLDLGGSYAYTRLELRDDHLPFHPEHAATAWAGVQFALGEHEGGVTLLQRVYESNFGTFTPTDLALRYTIPFPRFGLTLASDVTNVLGVEEAPFVDRRAARFWIRARL